MVNSINTLNRQTITSNKTVSTRIYNYGYYPLIKGDIAPISFLNKDLSISLQHYFDLHQPLVVLFLSGIDASSEILETLSNLQSKIQNGGGNLIVITNNNSRDFKISISKVNNLSIYFDKDNEIAEQFKLYDYANPLSNWLSGVDNLQAILPALYVIAPYREIVFHYIDYEFNLFSGAINKGDIVNQLIDTVNTLSTSYTHLRVWRNQLVS